MYPDDEMCPTYVDDVIRQGLPLLATMEGLEEGIVLVRLFWEDISKRQKYPNTLMVYSVKHSLSPD